MRIAFSDHAKRRMKERKISSTLVRNVVRQSDHTFIDIATNYTIFVKRLIFREEKRYIAVSVDKSAEHMMVVSVHPIRDRDLISRTESGRWV